MSDQSMYREQILEHSKDPHNFREIKDATKTLKAKNPLCGDDLVVYLKIEDHKITEASFSGQGCAISVAAASLLTDYIKGKKIEEILALTNDTFKADILGIEPTPGRIKCAFLALNTVKQGIL
ncbi:MAG: Fe-S cluster assembly sulfur transfer protein SufU [bacterium]